MPELIIGSLTSVTAGFMILFGMYYSRTHPSPKVLKKKLRKRYIKSGHLEDLDELVRLEG